MKNVHIVQATTCDVLQVKTLQETLEKSDREDPAKELVDVAEKFNSTN